MIAIEELVNKVIDRIKSFPHEARFSQADVGPKTSWDEFKEQLQYEEYEGFDLSKFQETVESMIDDALEKLPGKDFDLICNSIFEDTSMYDLGEMHEEIKDLVLSEIHEMALSEEIEYNSPFHKYAKYLEVDSVEEDFLVIAEIIKKISPSEYLLHIFSNSTPPDGKDTIEDLVSLQQDYFLEWISLEQFEELKKRFAFIVSSGVEGSPLKNGINTDTGPNRVTLYKFNSPRIDVKIEAYFEDEKLIILDYSIGETLEEFYGDSDNEHFITIQPGELKKVYPLFEIKEDDKNSLLAALAAKFNTNMCCSEFKDLMIRNEVKFEEDFW